MLSRDAAASGTIESSDSVVGHDSAELASNSAPTKRVPVRIIWPNVVVLAMLHLISLLGLYEVYPIWITYGTSIWYIVIGMFSGLGVTAGAHRLWTHRSYKAKWPLRVFLVFFQTVAVHKDVIEWARDHRCHHKYSETDADPHNANRGFFFAHMGWLLVRKHPEVLAKGKSIDLSDLYADPILRFQRRFYLPGVVLFSFFIPITVPVYFWGEDWIISGSVCMLRLCLAYHGAWLVNSAAHLWGQHPYDRHINPAENIVVSLITSGEGFHNYHHVFPHDYSTSEFGWSRFNLTTLFIDEMQKLGLAYDCCKVDPEVIRQRKLRTGEDAVSTKMKSN